MLFRSKKVSKKKISDQPVEQSIEDKSNSSSFEPVKAIADNVPIEQQVEQMITSGDTNGLETIYKKIVKELGKQNRAKSTHWGPLRNGRKK